jgi:hypothetical protein
MTRDENMKTQEKLCAFGCGKEVHNGRRLCKEHLEHQKNKMAAYRAKRKKLMLCSRCPNAARILPDGSASTLCDQCRAHVRTLEAQGAEA